MKKSTKTILWVAGSVLVLMIIAAILLPFLFGRELPFYPTHMFTPMMFPIGIFGMILFWGAIIYLVYRLLIQEKGTTSTTSNLSILQTRLSRGEISIEEYERLKQTLKEEHQ
ncbi:MAG: hypothetical protein JXL85_08330 [Bacilli bacterium]|nr:hypothetical protein [Bacilli bacterium]